MRQAMAQGPATHAQPKLPVAWVGALLAAVLVAVAAARLMGFSPVQDMGKAEIVQSRMLRFATDAAGVTVSDATTGQTIARTSAEGFIPGVLRGLNRMRQTERAGADATAAYRLEMLSNGELLLVDTATGVSLDIAAYGSGNAAGMAKFLNPQGDKS